jgi:hypothetical protein
MKRIGSNGVEFAKLQGYSVREDPYFGYYVIKGNRVCDGSHKSSEAAWTWVLDQIRVCN